jgi:hypothetical protein
MTDARASLDDGSLVDILDRLLTAGTVVAGDVLLGLAGVDLVRLDLRLLLSSVETLTHPDDPERGRPEWVPPQPEASDAEGRVRRRRTVEGPRREAAGSSATSVPAAQPGPPPVLPDVANDADRGLSRLVLALVDVIRQLMERQALHRMDGGSLSADEVERLGIALQALDQRMSELCTAFGLRREDVRLSLDRLVA